MQTAVEWLEEQFNNWKVPTSQMLFKQAKEMEKQQIIDAYQSGDGDAYNLDATKKWGEQYYNETYGSKGSELEQIDQTNPVTRGSTALVQTTSDKWKEYQDWLNEVPEISSQTEISDEEIKKQANIHGYEEHSFFTAATSNQKRLSWIAACKWYREQLKTK